MKLYSEQWAFIYKRCICKYVFTDNTALRSNADIQIIDHQNVDFIYPAWHPPQGLSAPLQGLGDSRQ
jgi:hypothetical protein